MDTRGLVKDSESRDKEEATRTPQVRVNTSVTKGESLYKSKPSVDNRPLHTCTVGNLEETGGTRRGIRGVLQYEGYIEVETTLHIC